MHVRDRPSACSVDGAATASDLAVMSQDPEALVPVEAARPPDPYERAYMPGEGVVLYRDKSRAPWQIHALFAFGVLSVFGTALAAGGAAGGALALALGLPVIAVAWLLFAVLRVTVSEGHVNVQYGLFGPTIPIAAIESAEAVRYDWKRFGGWGIRRSLVGDGEWLYNMPGDGGRAVRIVWRDARGRRRIHLIGSRRADELARQIARARAALPAAARPTALTSGE